MKLVLAAALALFAAPVFAQDNTNADATKDANTMTCKDLLAMDATSMSQVGQQVKQSMAANPKYSAMADADITKLAGDSCTAYPLENVMAAVKMNNMKTTTCTEMMAMDEAGMMDAGTTIKMYMKDDAKIGAMADADVMKMAGDACKAHPDVIVLDAVKM